MDFDAETCRVFFYTSERKSNELVDDKSELFVDVGWFTLPIKLYYI